MYAWSKFKADVNDWGQVGRWIMPGEEVSQSDLDVSDEEWQGLIDSGAVREDPYPDIPNDVAPAEHFAANPDEAPKATIDETTPSEEEIAQTELTGTHGEPNQEQRKGNKPWENR